LIIAGLVDMKTKVKFLKPVPQEPSHSNGLDALIYSESKISGMLSLEQFILNLYA